MPAIDAEEKDGARAAEDVADLAPAVADVDASGDRAEPGGAEVGDQVERRRRQEEGDDVAAADAAGRERRRDSVGEPVPVAVREALVAIAEGLGVRRLGRRGAEQRGQGRGGEHAGAS